MDDQTLRDTYYKAYTERKGVSSYASHTNGLKAVYELGQQPDGEPSPEPQRVAHFWDSVTGECTLCGTRYSPDYGPCFSESARAIELLYNAVLHTIGGMPIGNGANQRELWARHIAEQLHRQGVTP